METLFAIKVKCPFCFKSLMDESTTLDNEPTIKLNAKLRNENFWVRLSSVWGSYSVMAERSIGKDELIEFSCNHCTKVLNMRENCEVCSAPKVELFMSSGGKTHVCSRRGCKKHSIEIENVKNFLRITDDTFNLQNPTETVQKEVPYIKPKEKVAKKIFMNTYCPNCKTSIIKDDLITLKIINENNEQGILYLSPYLNIFTHRVDIELGEGVVARDLTCPTCNKSLMSEKFKCGKCGAPSAHFMVKAMGKNIPVDICSRKGCTWHGVNSDDLKMIFLEDSDEW